LGHTVHAVLGSRRRTGCLREHSGDERLRLLLNVFQMLACAETFRVSVCTSVPDRRARSHPSSVTTFRPPIDSPFPGAVRIARRDSPASSFTSTVHELVDDVGACLQFIADCFIARPFGRQIRSGVVDET
jgi:hypothetical protein